MKRIYLFIFIFSCAFLPQVKADYQFKGVHFLASYSECDQAALEDVEQLIISMRAAVGQSGATILDESKYVFLPNGLTMTFLLSESHASIHTYPEHQACFVDLFTCGDHCSFERFDQALRDYLKPQRINKKILSRTEEIEDKAS